MNLCAGCIYSCPVLGDKPIENCYLYQKKEKMEEKSCLNCECSNSACSPVIYKCHRHKGDLPYNHLLHFLYCKDYKKRVIKKELSREDMERAWQLARTDGDASLPQYYHNGFFDKICKELGL